VLVWSPLAFGFLTGRYRSSGTWDSATGRPALRPSNFDPGDATTRAKLAVVDQLLEVATDVGCTLPELAIAFTLSHPAVTSTIIGPRTPAQLTATLAGAGLVLDDAVLDRLDAIVAPGRDVYDPRRGQLSASLREPEARRLPPHLRGAA
jgi:aryl-alcohol dehydrogenase-like predicted oxidoreductase